MPGPLIIESNDLRKDFEALRSRGVTFVEAEPEDYPFGVRGTALDPDGNRAFPSSAEALMTDQQWCSSQEPRLALDNPQLGCLLTAIRRWLGRAVIRRVPDPAPIVEMLPLDVRADDSARACVEAVVHRTGRIDVLINNAGYELAGAVEELTLEEVRAQFETNFFGVVRMVGAVLPSMRPHKSGHIINVGSLSGLSEIPFLGVYSATKCALEGYTEALRPELKPLNIHVSLTEAGFLKRPMMSHRQLAASRVADCDPWRQRARSATRAHKEKGPGPEAVAGKLLEIVSSKTPRLHYLIGGQAKTVAWWRRFLPAGMYEHGVRRTFSI